MRLRSKSLVAAGIIGISFCSLSFNKAFAQQEASVEAQTEGATNWKQEFASDLEQLKQQRDAIKGNAQAAIGEEKDLIGQMQQAIQAGDYQAAKSIREQLKSTRRENMEQKQQDMQALKDYRQELRSDIKDARESGVVPPRRLNPPGDNLPGKGYEPVPSGVRDRIEDRLDRREDVRDRREDFRDRREDVVDRREDFRDRREDVRDRREDIMDRREDKWDARHNYPEGSPAWRRDRAEDIRDRREDVIDRREDVRDRREDVKDRREGVRDRREDKIDRREDKIDRKENRFDRREDRRDKKNQPGNQGVRDHGAGIGRGSGQGGANKADMAVGAQKINKPMPASKGAARRR